MPNGFRPGWPRPPALRLRLRLDGRSEGTVEAPNVVGEIRRRGLPAEGIVLLGAHLDSWDLAAGAHDDGAGCAQCPRSVPAHPRQLSGCSPAGRSGPFCT